MNRFWLRLSLGLLAFSAATALLPVSASAAGGFTGVWTSSPSTTDASDMSFLHAGWGRVSASWSTIQPTAAATYTWTALDQAVVNASSSGSRKVLFMVRDNPAWATQSPCQIQTGTERSLLTTFTTVLVNRYKGTIPDGPLVGQTTSVKYWQFYNEPDNTSPAADASNGLGGCFGTVSGTTPTPTGRINYAQMLEAVGTGVHATDPAASVVMGGMASGNYTDTVSPACSPADSCVFDRGFLQGVLSQLNTDHALGDVDLVGLHYYSSQAATFSQFGVDLIGRVGSLHQDMLNAGLTLAQFKAIIVDEGSYTDTIGTSTPDPNNPYNIGQRNYVVEALARSASLNLTGYLWFWLSDTFNGLGSDNAYGLLDVNGATKPAYTAFHYFNGLIDTASRFVGSPTLPAKLEGYDFTTVDARSLQIVWNQVDTTLVTYNLQGTITSVTDPLGDPVSASGTSLSIGSDPRFIFYTPFIPLSLTLAGSGSGTVSSAPAGVSCAATCSGGFVAGTAVTLTATSAPGSVFVGWSGACTGTGLCPVTMSAAQAVTATFGPPPVTTLAAPARLFDTRATGGPIQSGTSRCFNVAGLAGIPNTAAAVVLNVTAVGQTTNGWLTVFPNGQSVPATSTLNFGTSEYAMANGTIMSFGTGGQVCVNVGTVNSVTGSAQVILDATGFLAGSGVSQLSMLPSPVRLADTRAGGGSIATGASRCFQVAGIGGIPSNAAAVVLNLTAADYGTNGWLTAFPNGQAVPATSTLNFDRSEYAIANGTVMGIGTGGQVCVNVGTVSSAAGSADVVLDATGYLTSGALAYMPMLASPQRVIDTRTTGGPIPTGQSRCFNTAGIAGIPGNATGLVLNVTAAGYGTKGWLTAYPNGQAVPATSTLNFDTTEYAMANGAVIAVGSGGQVCVNVGTINSAAGSAQVVLDVVGYLVP